jgi:hypothetical protein
MFLHSLLTDSSSDLHFRSPTGKFGNGCGPFQFARNKCGGGINKRGLGFKMF